MSINHTVNPRSTYEVFTALFLDGKINKNTSADWAIKYLAEAGVKLEGEDVEQFTKMLPHYKEAGQRAYTKRLAEAYQVLSRHVSVMGNAERADDPLTEALRDHAHVSNKFAFAVLRAIGVNGKGGGGMKDGRISPSLWRFIDEYVI